MLVAHAARVASDSASKSLELQRRQDLPPLLYSAAPRDTTSRTTFSITPRAPPHLRFRAGLLRTLPPRSHLVRAPAQAPHAGRVTVARRAAARRRAQTALSARLFLRCVDARLRLARLRAHNTAPRRCRPRSRRGRLRAPTALACSAVTRAFSACARNRARSCQSASRRAAHANGARQPATLGSPPPPPPAAAASLVPQKTAQHSRACLRAASRRSSLTATPHSSARAHV